MDVKNDISFVEAVSQEEKKPELGALLELLDSRKYTDFVNAVKEIPTVDIALYYDEMEKEYYSRFFRLLPKDIAAEVFVLIDSDVQQHIIRIFDDAELAAMLSELYLDDTVDIIQEMPATVVKRILRNSTPENRGQINQLLNFPDDSAGSIMTTEYVRFSAGMTVGAALDHIRKVGIDKETIYTCYVTDSGRHLVGIVTARQLLVSDLSVPVSEIMEESVIFVKTLDKKLDVANKLEKYGFLALPVVDNESRLVGIVTVDDAIEVIREDIEEDFATIAGYTPSDMGYLKTGVFALFKSRIPWLLLLMISATFSSTILSGFEAMLPAVLVLFVPMLMDTGGNSGGQASVTLIRGLSLGEITVRDAARIMWKEARVGVFCGIVLGAVTFAKVYLVDRLLMGNADVTMRVMLIISVTIALTVIVSKLIGSALPLIATAFKLDPAVMASPFITTIVDALALVLYFGVSNLLLNL